MKQKLRLSFLKFFGKKAYLQIDFTFAVGVFFMFFFVVFNIYNGQVQSEEENLISSKLQADAKDICFLLVDSSGSPNNWENNVSSVNFPALKNLSSQSIDAGKLSSFNSSNYFYIIDAFSISSYVYIKIDGLNNGTNYLNFGTKAGNSNFQAASSCYSTYLGEIVRVYVEVWR
ncbi:MAG: hypothetical protein KC589_08815 [Nanoarchaeota archaeon]|nr:hypothetical protein [Nanoarchaeota archaeon]